MSKEMYILKKQVHFGSLKTSVPVGTIIEVDRENNKAYFCDVEHDNISEIDICIRVGSIIPYIDGQTKVDANVKISPRAKNNKKYEVIGNESQPLSIKDQEDKNEEISTPKKMQVIREEQSSDNNKLKVLKHDTEKIIEVDNNEKIMQVINDDDNQVVAKIPIKKTKPKGVPENTTIISNSDSEALSAINGEQGRVVKSIGKSDSTKSVSSTKKLTAKHASKDSAEKAKANAEARKKASEARRAKAKENK